MTTAAEPTGGSPQVARGPGGGRRQGARPRQGRRPVRIAPGWTEGPGVPWSPVVCRSELAPVRPDSHASVVARPRRADAKAGLANGWSRVCLLYTSDAADEEDSVDLGGRRIIKKKKTTKNK